MSDLFDAGRQIVERIRQQNLTIYTSLPQNDLFLSNQQLEAVLGAGLIGHDFAGLPIRTRSKAAKQKVCELLGYPVPSTFTKVRPRFRGQNFDVYVQKADNLQIWNEEVSPSRRYVVVRVDDADKVTAVKVVSGEVIALLDKTGTLTQKYQAALREPVTASKLVSLTDTSNLVSLRNSDRRFLGELARFRDLLPVAEVFERLRRLEGQRFKNPGHTQERNRGAALHSLAQKALGGAGYSDTGQFPDIIEQLVEVKLQTSPTIDLGLVSSDHTDPVAAIPLVRHCDVRYAVVYGHVEGADVVIKHIVVATGADFFTVFRRFAGKEVNKKLQLPLPKSFFESGSESK